MFYNSPLVLCVIKYLCDFIPNEKRQTASKCLKERKWNNLSPVSTKYFYCEKTGCSFFTSRHFLMPHKKSWVSQISQNSHTQCDPPAFSRVGWTFYQIFKKMGGGLHRISIFRGIPLPTKRGKEGVSSFRGLQFLHKKTIIWNIWWQKKLINKNVFLRQN